MIETTNRQNGETYLAYVKRIVQMVRDSKIGYIEMGDALLGVGNVYSSENLRKAYYVLDKMIDKIDGDAVITDNDILIEIEKQKDELYKERVRLRDKKRELNALLTAEARYENLVSVLKENIDKLEPLQIERSIPYVPSETEACLILSDFHYGIKIDNQVNHYNIDIAKDRVTQLVDKTIEFCCLHRVKTLNIEILGDMCNGHINVGNRVEQEEDAISQIINVSELLTKAIRILANSIKEAKVFCVFGNHSRLISDKKQAITPESVERLIFEYLKLRLPDIEVVTSKTDDYLVTNVANRKIVLCHGNNDSPTACVKNFVNILDFKPDEIHMGHFHTFGITNDNDCEIVVNGSLVSTDDYALSIRRATKASQTLRIYGVDTCTYNIILN